MSTIEELRRRLAADPEDEGARRRLDAELRRASIQKEPCGPTRASIPLDSSWPTLRRSRGKRHILLRRLVGVRSELDRHPAAQLGCRRVVLVEKGDVLESRDPLGFAVREPREEDCRDCAFSQAAAFIDGAVLPPGADVSEVLLFRYGVVNLRRGFSRRPNSTQIEQRDGRFARRS